MTLRRGRLKKRMGRLSGRPGGNLPQPLPSPRPSPGRLSGKEPSRTAPGVGPAIPSGSGGREPRPSELPEGRPTLGCRRDHGAEAQVADELADYLVRLAHNTDHRVGPIRIWPWRPGVETARWKAYVDLYREPGNSSWDSGALCAERREGFYDRVDDAIERAVRKSLMLEGFSGG
jgi:hypothetical protein